MLLHTSAHSIGSHYYGIFIWIGQIKYKIEFRLDWFLFVWHFFFFWSFHFFVYLELLLCKSYNNSIVLTNNLQFECGRYLALVAGTDDARCDAIVQTVVSVFIQFIDVQIVANLLNTMVVTDECIWIDLRERKIAEKKISQKKNKRIGTKSISVLKFPINAENTKLSEFRFGFKQILCINLTFYICNSPLCVQAYCIPWWCGSGHFNVIASPSIGLIMVVDSFWSMWKSPLLTAAKWKIEMREKKERWVIFKLVIKRHFNLFAFGVQFFSVSMCVFTVGSWLRKNERSNEIDLCWFLNFIQYELEFASIIEFPNLLLFRFIFT